MDKEITFEEFEKIFLRFINRHPQYHGEVHIKFYDGKIANLKTDDSYDLKELRKSKLRLNESN